MVCMLREAREDGERRKEEGERESGGEGRRGEF